ncbi:hypothetical protein JJQ59_37720 (plasmid) [Cupriavidus necator]|uniref:Uncharacterized protein n=1 Tax=Cupriavidus necator TaxID=106590 RepID=A0A367P6W2_CUPNE|nr:hypothetical protein [Cupriavidus necator]QQX89285.1 hypothetical protein JJQ59_37720 [Cupriavidus necator]RCJ03569.1 hypothetical protein DDK22_36550 [Cupriavidus necator]
MASMALRAAFTTATDTISPSLFMWPVALIDSPIGAKDKLLVNRSEAANCRLETVHLKPCVDDDLKKRKEIRTAKIAVDCHFSVAPAVDDRSAFACATGARRNASQAIL